MGTIAEKLTYLNTTKIKLRDSLNKFGSNILTTDTFRSYDTKLNDIYNKLPKVTQSGVGFTLLDVQNGQIDDFKMIGVDLEQSATTGKQLFDINSEMNTNSLLDAGITSTFNEDGTITVNGEKTANYKYIRYYVTLPAGTYYFCGCPSGGSNSSYSSLVQLTQDTSSQVFDIGNGGTFTLTEQTTIQYFPVRVGNANLTFNNTIFKPMISTTPVTYDDFEKYTGGIPSPNPDYPQEIKVVEGRQVITDKGKNLFDKDNANIMIASFSQDYKKISQVSNNAKILYIPCKGNTTYTVSKKSSERFRILTTEIVPALEVAGIDFIQNETATSLTITTSSNVNYLCVYYFINGTDTLTEQEILDSIQIEENSSATDYESYYNPVGYNIDLTNDLLKYNKCDFIAESIAWYFLDGNSRAYGNNIGTKTNIKFPVEQNKVYTFRYNVFVEPLVFQLCYDNENIIATLEKSIGNNSFTFTSDRNGYVVPRVRVNASSQVKITGISVVEGEEDYYDYKLAKMPNIDYKNRIYKNNGNWYFEENAKMFVLDGSENWVKNSYSFYWNGDMFSNKPVSICSHFVDNGSTWTNSNEALRGKYTTTNAAQFKCMPLEDMTLNEFKTWLSTHNVDVWCQLDIPITTQITNTTLINQLEAISVYTGTNIITISNDNNIIPEIEITRLKELEKMN